MSQMDRKLIWPVMYERAKEFSRVAFSRLREYHSKGQDIPVNIETFVEKHAEGGWGISRKQVPLPELFVLLCAEGLKQLSEYRLCEEYMSGEPIISAQLNKFVSTGLMTSIVSTDKVLLWVLSEMVRSDPGLKFDPERFDAIYSRMEEFLASPSLRFVSWVPLKNFEAKTDPIELEKGVGITPIPDSVIRDIYLKSEHSYGASVDLLNYKYAIRLSYELRKFTVEAHTNFEEVHKSIEVKIERPVDRVLTALRLTKAGVVGRGPMLVERTTWGLDEGKGVRWNFVEVPYRPSYILEDSDINALKENLSHLQRFNASKYPFLALGLRRFNLGYERLLPEDRLIDYMIAFEALYLNDQSERSELGFRLALRAAHFLRDHGEQSPVYQDMRTSYGLRSSIVHGNHKQLAKFSKDNMSSERFVERIEGYLRETLVKFLALAQREDVPLKLVDWDSILFR